MQKLQKGKIVQLNEMEADLFLTTFLETIQDYQEFAGVKDETKWVHHYDLEEDDKIIGFISNEDETEEEFQVDIWQLGGNFLMSVWRSEFMLMDFLFTGTGELLDVRKLQ